MTTIPMLQKELEQAYKDIKYYKNRIERLNNQLQQKENVIKEVREYVKQLIDLKEEDYLKSVSLIYIEKILEILDKASDD